jgi:hypothetical protein
MDTQTLINELNNIYSSYNDDYIIILFRKLYSFDNDIKLNVSPSLYDKWETEIQCLRNESIYGNNDSYTDNVIDDCISVLKEIIDELSHNA